MLNTVLNATFKTNKQKILLKKFFLCLNFFFPVKLFLILKTATVSDITTDHDFPRTQST